MNTSSLLLLLVFSYLLLLLLPLSSSHNITQILQRFPDYSSFNSLLTKYGVASQINTRTTITVLCPSNSALDPRFSSLGNNPSPQTIFDILSYHVLLDYYDLAKLKQLNGMIQATTLFQTTGLAAGTNGFVNISDVAGSPEVELPAKGSRQKATIIKDLVLFPYNISVLSISKVLVPDGATSQASVNITQLILQGGNYTTFVSLAQATGVDSIFQGYDLPPGITIFVPTNAAFDAMPPGALSKLSSAQKVALLEYHSLRSYYPMQALSSLSSNEQNTLASGSGGDAYTLTVKTKGGSTLINSGLNSALVDATLYSNNPVAIFSVSSVLLPTDIFGSTVVTAPSHAPASSSTPSLAPTPLTSPPSLSPSPALSPTPPSTSPLLSPASSPPAPPPGVGTSSHLAPSPGQSTGFATNFAAPLAVNHACIVVPVFIAAMFSI